MLTVEIPAIQIEANSATTVKEAYVAIAETARFHLQKLGELALSGSLPANVAAISRAYDFGPGSSYAALLHRLLHGVDIQWECPFEGSHNVSGAAIRGADVLQDPTRTDGFLLLRFSAGTLDLPLHIHPASDRFIVAIRGQGLFHVSPASLDDVASHPIRNGPVRGGDALMFRRGAVHTFSTAQRALTLLSYHQPFIELDDPEQYLLTQPPLMPKAFLARTNSTISFDTIPFDCTSISK